MKTILKKKINFKTYLALTSIFGCANKSFKISIFCFSIAICKGAFSLKNSIQIT